MKRQSRILKKKQMDGKKLSRTKAVRIKCLDCCGYQVAEVTKCPAVDCPLWCFRMGKDESGKKPKPIE